MEQVFQDSVADQEGRELLLIMEQGHLLFFLRVLVEIHFFLVWMMMKEI